MPYRLGKGGKCGDTGWGVYKRDTGELVACHTTRRLAAAQFRLLEMITHEETKAATLKAWTVKYSEEQARDDHGRFGSGGGGSDKPAVIRSEPHYIAFKTKGGAQVSITVAEKHRDKPPKVMDKEGSRVRMAGLGKDGLPTPENQEALAKLAGDICDKNGIMAVQFEINNEDFTANATTLGSTNNWGIISLRSYDMKDTEVQDTVAHELGHVLDNKIGATNDINSSVMSALYDDRVDPEGMVGLQSISPYAAGNSRVEAYAETFMSYVTGRYAETQTITNMYKEKIQEPAERTATRIAFVERVAKEAGWKKP